MNRFTIHDHIFFDIFAPNNMIAGYCNFTEKNLIKCRLLKQKIPIKKMIVAGPKGFEPPAYGLRVHRSA
jgi:hypothetical protein